MSIIWILIIFVLYALIGTLICDKLGILYDCDDFIYSLVDGILITFWPFTVIIHFLLND